jgi:hypothetical protein
MLRVGRATFTIVLSTTTMNRLRQSTAKIHQRRAVALVGAAAVRRAIIASFQ